MNRIRLGYACVNLSLGENGRTSRTCRLSNASPNRLETLARENLSGLVNVLNWNVAQSIRLYRISSGVIPLASHPQAQWPWRKTLKRELVRIGRLVRDSGLRVSMHPGQYTVLNSPHRQVAESARAELQYHANFLDQSGLDGTHKIILHVGGLYGDRNASLDRFQKRFDTLPLSVRSRLVLENDERSYKTGDVLALSESLGIPMVFDYLHHIGGGNELPTKRLLTRIYDTWSRSDGRPELHYSTQRTGSRMGSHANMINARGFVRFTQLLPAADIDIMLEAKSKDLALLNLRHKLLTRSRNLRKWVIA